MLSMFHLLLVLSLGGFFALFMPLWTMILLDLSFITFFGSWSLGFLIGPSDLMFGMMVAGILIRGRRSEEWRLVKFPFMFWWLILLILLCLSYLQAPINQPNLTDPVRIIYQLTRYCLRPIVYLPLVLIHLRSAHRSMTALFVIQIAAFQVALMAVKQGLTGMSATPGPFLTGNQLGGVLVMPILMAMVGALLPLNRFHFWISFLSLPFLARALLYCESRGAMVAVFAGIGFLGALLLHRHIGRQRLRWFSPIFAIGFIAILPAMPIILSRPTIKHALSASDAGEDSNMKWRMEQRWPHFWAIALENPWFGVGTEVDPSLGPKANTPHNGFLAMTVLWGFPAASIIIVLAFRSVFNGLALYRRARNPDHQVFGLTVAAAMFAMLTHQVVEVTLIAVFPYKVFWLMLGTSELGKRWPDDDLKAPAAFLTSRQLHGFEPLPEPLPRPQSAVSRS